MKYDRMLCWVSPQEKKEIIEVANGQIPLVFAKNFNDFKKQINVNDYLVMSMTKISIGWEKMNDFIKSFQNIQFHLFDKKYGWYTLKELLFLTAQENIVNKKYYPEELIEEFKVHSQL